MAEADEVCTEIQEKAPEAKIPIQKNVAEIREVIVEEAQSSNPLDTWRQDTSELKVPFDTVRCEIDSKLKKCNERVEATEKLYLEAANMTKTLEEKYINATNEQKEWKDVKVKLAQTLLTGKVTLNVGGERYTTSVPTLMREKDTYFTEIFSQKWELQLDDIDKSIFIDRNGQLFTYILEYLRTDMIPDDVINNKSLRYSLMVEAKYFRLPNFIIKLDIYFPDGTLLQSEQKMKLNEFYGEQSQQWELIYKASRDGFGASVFHSRCDNKGPTMTIIQSNNNFLFGGYTAVAWTSDGSYKNDTTAFLFSLTNPHNIPPTKYLIKPANIANSVLHNRSYGPIFGSGPDLQLANNSNSSNSSIGFPTAYTDTTGKGNVTFTGANTYIASEIEVFKLA